MNTVTFNKNTAAQTVSFLTDRKHSGSFYDYDIISVTFIPSDSFWFADVAVEAAGIIVCFCLHCSLDCWISDFLFLFDLWDTNQSFYIIYHNIFIFI